MSRIFILLTISLYSLSATAQVQMINRERDYLYWLDLKQINPAFAGFEGSQFLFESRMNIFSGDFRQRTGTVSADILQNDIKSAFGILFSSTTLGSTTHSEVNIQYNYRISWNNSKSFLAAGLGIHGNFHDIDYTDYRVIDPSDPWLSNNSDASSRFFNLDFGVAMKLNKTTIGLSVSDIIRREINFFSQPQVVGTVLSVYADREFSISESFRIKPGFSFLNFPVFNLERKTRLDGNCMFSFKSLLFGTGISSFIDQVDGTLFVGYDVKSRFRLVLSIRDNLTPSEADNDSGNLYSGSLMGRVRF